jgi:hypothetical protein
MVWQLSADIIAAWVRASCEAQGLPFRVASPEVLGKVAVLLTGKAGTGAARAAARVRHARVADPQMRQIGSTRDGSST